MPAQFPQTSARFDPYKNFRFRVKWDGKYVAGFSKMSALDRTTPPVSHRAGGDQNVNAAITLERGVTHDATFAQWCNKVWDYSGSASAEVGGQEVALADFRKDLVVELFDEAGRKARAWTVHRCWVSEFQAMPDLDANTNAVAIAKLKLENEGRAPGASVAESGVQAP